MGADNALTIGLLIVCFVLIISFAAADTFYDIARMKGHDEKKYFLWSFFVPLLGALMVIALPDRKMDEKLTNGGSPRESAGVSPLADTWTAHSASPVVKPSMSGAVQKPSADGNQFACPACGKMQRSDRNVCWHCGVRFDGQ